MRLFVDGLPPDSPEAEKWQRIFGEARARTLASMPALAQDADVQTSG